MDQATEDSGEQQVGGVLAKPEDVLPSIISILPVAERPFFPSQMMPMILPIEPWQTLVKQAQEKHNGILGVVYNAAGNSQEVDPEKLSEMGTACRIHQVQEQDGNLQIVLIGIERFSIDDWVSHKHPLVARVTYYPESKPEDDTQLRAYTTAIINVIKELLPLNSLYAEELKQFLSHFGPGDPSKLADFGASLTTAKATELQEVLQTLDIISRLAKAHVLLQKELEVARAQMEIRQHVEKEIQDRQREMFLREQLKFIQSELGISKDDRTQEIETFRERMENMEIPQQANQRMEEELEKLAVLERGSPEYTVTRNYLDWLTLLPWGSYSEDQLDLSHATKILDEDHEGLKDIKDRIKEFLGVGIMRGGVGGNIILLVGPPGVGKTSLGQSIARALGRQFFRFSLGGMRDEAEIKGHRRTYIGAMPGKLIQALKEAGTANPVIMLDEIDKIGASYHGDPASALLEVLDPEQNAAFLDHYLDVRFDLSRVLFICTANQLDTVPDPLLDRMELLHLSGYLAAEKVKIARNHLLPRQLVKAGLRKRGDLRIDTAALKGLVEEYARESGVRHLEKLLARIVRKGVMKLIEGATRPIHVRAADLEDYVGKPLFANAPPRQEVGSINGLAWTPLGGATLIIEARQIHNFRRGLKMTGQLGDVMQESAEIAYSYVMSQVSELNISEDFFKDAALHLHVPAGATPKDGPSAGITMASALVSLAINRKPATGFAMTGELTLAGHVLAIGGIQEKVIAAKRAGIRKLIVPEANRGDFESLPEYLQHGVAVKFVSEFSQVVKYLFPGK